MAECERHVFTEVQQFIHGKAEVICDMAVEPQEYTVFPLGKCRPDALSASGLACMGRAKFEGNMLPADFEIGIGVSAFSQPPYKCIQHFIRRKGDLCF